MGQSMKRTLFAITVVVFLLPACTAAPAPTQDPTLSQQLIDQSVALTMVEEHRQATEQQALVVVSTPTSTLTPTPTLTPGRVNELPDLPTFTPTSTPVISPTPLVTFSPTPTVGYDIYCDPYIESTQQPQLLSQLETGKTVMIKNRVNLRTQPSRLNRILLVLKPGTQVKIIGGPVETQYDIGKYVWWQVEIPGGLTGWSAELSVCGRYYFLDPSTATATTSP